MKNKENSNKKNISRKEAIVKVGKYAAVTAAATFIILNPKQSQAGSPGAPGWGKAEPPATPSTENKNKPHNA